MGNILSGLTQKKKREPNLFLRRATVIANEIYSEEKQSNKHINVVCIKHYEIVFAPSGNAYTVNVSVHWNNHNKNKSFDCEVLSKDNFVVKIFRNKKF